MTGDDRFEVAFYALALILPVSALLARRLPLRRTALLALAWAAIIAGAVVAVNVGRHGLAERWQRLAEMARDDDQQVSGGTIRVPMAADGHFWANAKINGVPRRMLIDSGATTTALSTGTAQAAGIARDDNAFPAVLETANGRVAADVATVDTLTLGPVTARKLRVVVAPAFGTVDVLGMNFLSRLGEWRVEGRTLILTASKSATT